MTLASPSLLTQTTNKSLKTRRNLKLLKAMKDIVDNPEHILDKTEEEKKTSKNSTASADQNYVSNIMKKSRSISNNSLSQNKSSDRQENLTSLSDMRNNSMNDRKGSNPRAKTEKSVSKRSSNNENNYESGYSPLIKKVNDSESHRKDSQNTIKTSNVGEQRKFSNMASGIKNPQRSKSFSKP